MHSSTVKLVVLSIRILLVEQRSYYSFTIYYVFVCLQTLFRAENLLRKFREIYRDFKKIKKILQKSRDFKKKSIKIIFLFITSLF